MNLPLIHLPILLPSAWITPRESPLFPRPGRNRAWHGQGLRCTCQQSHRPAGGPSGPCLAGPLSVGAPGSASRLALVRGERGSCFASGSPDSVSFLPQGAGLLCSPGFSAAAPEAWSSGLVLPRFLDELGKSLALTGASLPYLQGGNNETHLPALFLGTKAHSPQWAFRNAGWNGDGRPVTGATRPGDREKDWLGGRHWARHPYNGIRSEGWGGEAKEAQFQARSWGF